LNIENYRIPDLNDPRLIAARVTAVHRDRFEIMTVYGPTHAQMKRGLQFDEMPTVGDLIEIEYNPGGDSVAVGVLPRRTLFARQDTWHGGRQLVAANVDIAFITTSLNADFNIRRLERYLALALESGAEPVFLLTKRDLVDDLAVDAVTAQVYGLAPDCRVLTVSARSGFGMDKLEAMLTPGTVAVLLGSSGVGKSSIVNALLGAEAMDTGEIRSDDKGRHTTVHRQMLELTTGALLIDTPGMRELAMWDNLDGVADVFSEIEAAAQRCRFRDCSHTHEPGCAILAGLEDGTLDPGRVGNYLKMHSEADHTTRMAEKRRRSMEIAKFSREMKKAGKIRR
jgi:ribosome biogenesis GTPase